MLFKDLEKQAKQDGKNHVLYLTYKVQRALYELQLTSKNPIEDWNEFVFNLRRNVELQEAASRVALYAVQHYDCSGFPFDEPEQPAKEEPQEGEDTIIELSRLFTDKFGDFLEKELVNRAQEAYYAHLAQRRGPDYTWSKFRRELARSYPMVRTVTRAFLYALATVDFKTPWLAEGVQILDK